MKAIVRKDKEGKIIDLVTMDVPKVKPNFALVKIHASPINPSDLSFMKATYGNPSKQPNPPLVLGFEGSGVVVEIGEGVDKSWIGKRVCFFSDCHSMDYIGNWCNYSLKTIESLLIVSDKVDLDSASMTQVNPKTIMGFFHIINTENHKGVVHTAAASALGKMLIKLCLSKGIETINIVRKKANVDCLKAIGAKYVFDSEDPNFEKDIKEAISVVKPTIFFDALGGSLPGLIFNAMPFKSQLHCYGSLVTPELVGIKGTDLRYNDKTIKGFHIARQFELLPVDIKKVYIDFIWKDLEEGGKIFKSDVAAKFPLTKWDEAIKSYPDLASKGKILFKPNE